MRDLDCKWLIVAIKCFEFVLHIFEFFRVKEIVESWLIYLNMFSWIIQSKLVPASFSYFLKLLWEKNKF